MVRRELRQKRKAIRDEAAATLPPPKRRVADDELQGRLLQRKLRRIAAEDKHQDEDEIEHREAIAMYEAEKQRLSNHTKHILYPRLQERIGDSTELKARMDKIRQQDCRHFTHIYIHIYIKCLSSRFCSFF